MKLIIDIPDIKYQNIVNAYSDINEIYAAIKNGTPLDKIRDEIEERKVHEELGDVFMAHNIAIDEVLQIIDKYTKGAEK